MTDIRQRYNSLSLCANQTTGLKSGSRILFTGNSLDQGETEGESLAVLENRAHPSGDSPRRTDKSERVQRELMLVAATAVGSCRGVRRTKGGVGHIVK